MQATLVRFIDSLPILRAVRPLVASVFRRARPVESTESSAAMHDITPVLFQNALTNEHTRSMLRERLSRGSGNECWEFLIAVRSFEEAGNGLQRYQLLTDIVHRFVRPGAQRQIPVSDKCRGDMLREWQPYVDEERIPPRVPFNALAAATIEISTLMVVGPREDAAPLKLSRHTDSSTPLRSELRFRSLVHRGHGLAFPCTEAGKVAVDQLTDEARVNYMFARAMVGREFASPCVESA
jgi:hypothetical protein